MPFWKPSRPKPASVVAPTQTPVAPPVLMNVDDAKPKSDLELAEAAANRKHKGFDPYNSGAFKVKDTWAKVDRKK